MESVFRFPPFYRPRSAASSGNRRLRTANPANSAVLTDNRQFPRFPTTCRPSNSSISPLAYPVFRRSSIRQFFALSRQPDPSNNRGTLPISLNPSIFRAPVSSIPRSSLHDRNGIPPPAGHLRFRSSENVHHFSLSMRLQVIKIHDFSTCRWRFPPFSRSVSFLRAASCKSLHL